jgi:hypothetical protein
MLSLGSYNGNLRPICRTQSISPKEKYPEGWPTRVLSQRMGMSRVAAEIKKAA